MFGALTTLHRRRRPRHAERRRARLCASSIGRIETENRIERAARARPERATAPADVDAVARRSTPPGGASRPGHAEGDRGEAEGEGQAEQVAAADAAHASRPGSAGRKRTFFIVSVVCGVVVFLVAWLFGAAALRCGRVSRGRRCSACRAGSSTSCASAASSKFLNEFANAVDVIVRGVKAGLPLNDCIRIIANEAAEPVRSEFRKIVEDQALGMSLADAVAKLPERDPAARGELLRHRHRHPAEGRRQPLRGARQPLERAARPQEDEGQDQGDEHGGEGLRRASSARCRSSSWSSSISPAPTTSAALHRPLGNIILGASAVWMFIGVLVMRKMINFDF